MFLCDPCLKKNFTNFGMFKSYGKCEHCNKKTDCYDIPSRHLELKKESDSDEV